MATKAIITGGILIILGIVVSIASSSESVTSWIPAFIGALFVALGVAARLQPNLNHHIMHGAAALSLLAILGSLGSLIGRGSTGWALLSQLVTIIVVGGFLFQAIGSFKEARRARLAQAN